MNLLSDFNARMLKVTRVSQKSLIGLHTSPKEDPFVTLRLLLLLIVLSACGGIRTCSSVPVLTACFPVLKPYWEKVYCPPQENCLAGQTGSST